MINNISTNQLVYLNNYINNHNEANSIFIYLFQLFLLYNLLPDLFLNLVRTLYFFSLYLVKILYFFSLYLVNFQDERIIINFN